MLPILLATVMASTMITNSNTQAIPRPEHPRPDFERANWLNLNGKWQFAESDTTLDLDKVDFKEQILVPFARESPLSGINRKGFVKNVWYKRTFQKPNWNAPRTKLHIDACDWQTTIWVNNEKVGTYVGGNSPISFDITNYLKDGENTVIVHAYDDTKGGIQGTGKQAHTENSAGIFYTRTTGIWQTVWLEGVGEASVENFHVVPDVANKKFSIQAEIKNGDPSYKLRVTAYDNGKEVAVGEAPAIWRNARLELNIKSPKLWSVESPFLYDLKIELLDGNKVLDSVKSYAGLRDVAIKGRAILINGKPVFQRLVLDQGFYPDGTWTAPSDEALKNDIVLSKEAGFNGARLHQKVFEPRFLYWADKLGYLCWGEYPNYGLNHKDARGERPYLEEWSRIVQRDRNHPAIIGWCPFNETPKEAGPLQDSTFAITKILDPTRPVIDTSGYIHSLQFPEVMDAHDYDQNPVTFAARWKNLVTGADLPARYASSIPAIPFFLSEYGGIGWDTGSGWGYGSNPKTEEEFFARLKGLTEALTSNPGMFGFCYTQLTDVEQERNGIFTYDRKPKFDLKKFKAIFGLPAAIEKNQQGVSKPSYNWSVLLGANVDGSDAAVWKYTFDVQPEGWEKNANTSSWKTGKGGFGSKSGFESLIKTEWTTKDIYMQTEVDYDGSDFKNGTLVIHYDNAATVYVNGNVIWKANSGAWNDNYDGFEVTQALKKALKKGKNVVSVHCHQDTGGQFIDLALILGR
jgi:hypothetical protein